jgi:hypothetical protein
MLTMIVQWYDQAGFNRVRISADSLARMITAITEEANRKRFRYIDALTLQDFASDFYRSNATAISQVVEGFNVFIERALPNKRHVDQELLAMLRERGLPVQRRQINGN